MADRRGTAKRFVPVKPHEWAGGLAEAVNRWVSLLNILGVE